MLLSSIRSEGKTPEVPDSATLQKLTAADLMKMVGSQAAQARLIAELEARWIMHFVIPENLDTATH
jgi:hypothetical protein